LRGWDSTLAVLWVRVSWTRGGPADADVYVVNVALSRGVFTANGPWSADVWNKGEFGPIGSHADPPALMREAVQRCVKKFADEWRLENE
jgi:hypothetical protein